MDPQKRLYKTTKTRKGSGRNSDTLRKPSSIEADQTAIWLLNSGP